MREDQATPRRWPAFRSEYALLVFIVLYGAGLRLLWIGSPLLDAHRWRQADTAAIARNLYRGHLNVFYPEVDWGGRNGYVESEFPLMPALAALLYTIFGQHDYLGRLVSVLFSTATIVALWALGCELLGTAGGLAAAFLLAASPAGAFYGRTFTPDSSMLFFWVAGVLGFVRYFKRQSLRDLWWGSLLAALACLAKIPALMMLAPCVGAAWHYRRWASLRDRAFMLALALPLAATAAWYIHAFLLYRQTGLTFGILAHPARTYPLSIAEGPWPYIFAKWSTLDLLTDSNYYGALLFRLYHQMLSPWGFVGALVGIVFWKPRDGRIIADFWFAALIVFALVMGSANWGHDYYQLPFVPVCALYFGACAGPVLNGRSRGIEQIGVWPTVALSAVLLAIGSVTFVNSNVIKSHFRPNSLDGRVVQAAGALEQVLPGDALLIVVDDYGSTSPLLLYFVHRKGWSFDVENIFPYVIEGLKRQGARYFVTTRWSQIRRQSPDTAAYLLFFRRIPLVGEPKDTAAFDLTRTTSEP